MKLSTRARYGTRALLDLALHWGEGPILLKGIAQRQRISLSYLEHLISPLIAAGIVKSTRGLEVVSHCSSHLGRSSLVRWFDFLRAQLLLWNVSIIPRLVLVLTFVLLTISGMK